MVGTTSRAYRSRARDEQAGATRTAIAAALAHQLVTSPRHDPSLPEVAREAGVGLRTVYHHFPDRPARLAAVASWAADVLGHLPPIDGAAALPDHCRRVHTRAAAEPVAARALAATVAAEPPRDRRRRTHELEIAALLTGVGAPAEPTRRATAVVALLCSAEAHVGLVDGHGLEPADAGEAAADAVAATVAALRAKRRAT
jgi:AcrR family transcriptional regulator